MLDPTSPFSQRIKTLMKSGDFTGHQRPVGRVTFQDVFNNRYRSTTRPGFFRSSLFGQGAWVGPDGETRGGGPAHEANELQVSSIDIGRALGQDAATCVIVLPNVRPGAYAPQGDDDDPFGFGYLSSMRGVQNEDVTSVYGEKTLWGYEQNSLSRLLRTNYLVRTYQGYGSDNFNENGDHRSPSDPSYVHPHFDSKVTLTGVWLIDKVSRTANPGQIPTITIECRDLAKLLITQFIYPTMIPKKRFPLVYRPLSSEDNELSNPSASSSRSGYPVMRALDDDINTYWQSSPRPSFSSHVEYVEAACSEPINTVSFRLKGEDQRWAEVYVSVQENGLWRGDTPVPKGSIPYVAKRDGVLVGEVRLPRTYNATKVRLSFTRGTINDWDGYSVAVHDLRAYRVPAEGEDFGAIRDWSEAIKELVAWAGFTWWGAPNADDLIGVDEVSGKKMAVWGDFEWMGAGPIEETPSDYFVSKSFMDGIRQIVDFLGGIFYIDHTGGVQYRMPNVWSSGSFIVDPNSPRRKARINSFPIEFHEDVNLLGFSVSEDDASMRHEILVVGDLDKSSAKPVSGGVSLIAPDMPVSFRGLLNGQKRLMQVPGDATKLFKTAEECQRMAELIGVKMLFAYRKAQSTIIADPRLHLDDQVRIFEKTSGESFTHYVTGIDSTMDLNTGQWQMTVTSHWLGTDPNTDWFLDTQQLTNSVLDLESIRKAMGRA